MEKYNYLEAIKADVRTYIDDEINLDDFSGPAEDREDLRQELEEKLNDDLWIADSVTGNASGSYYCNAWKAEEALCHNWDLLAEALEEFGGDFGEAVKRGAEYCDVTIRCYLLGQAIAAALDDLGI